MNSLNPAHLIARCRAGDALAVEDLVAQYQPVVYRLAESVLDDPAEAQEAAQDALVAMLSGLKSYRGDAAFKTWLYAITLNVCRRRLQKRQARVRLRRVLTSLFRSREKTAWPEEAAARRERDRAVWQAVTGLAEPYRMAIVLRYYEALSIAEIARLLNVGERTVYMRLQKAHERLRATLNGKVDL